MNLIYDEIHKNRHLIPFNLNLIIQLLHTIINYNYFEFGTFIFQQTNRTAIGVAFSLTNANIYISITLRNVLLTQPHKPQLRKRYIDDIMMDTNEELLRARNEFNPSLHFTYTYSQNSIDFLDLTIYKGTTLSYTLTLDTKTYQKPLNLYQYIHYTSNQTRQVHKAITTGECIRCVRTNTVSIGLWVSARRIAKIV